MIEYFCLHQCVQTGSESTRPPTIQWTRAALFLVAALRRQLKAYHLVPRLKMLEALPPLHHTFSWCEA